MMLTKKDKALARRSAGRDPFALLRQLTSEFDQAFSEPFFRWPVLRAQPMFEAATWFPEVDVFKRDDRLVTKIDLPGMKKEDVKVEIADGQLVISGERKSEAEEKKDDYYRCEREYGSFYRTVPLPAGAKVEDVKATFTDGVLEVSVPLPVAARPEAQKVPIQEAAPQAEKPKPEKPELAAV
jgi:HSP20 family protein